MIGARHDVDQLLVERLEVQVVGRVALRDARHQQVQLSQLGEQLLGLAQVLRAARKVRRRLRPVARQGRQHLAAQEVARQPGVALAQRQRRPGTAYRQRAGGALRPQRQRFGGAGEAQVAGGCFETLQGGDRGQMSFVQHGMPLFILCMNKGNDISPNRRLLASLGPATNRLRIAVQAAARFFYADLKE